MCRRARDHSSGEFRFRSDVLGYNGLTNRDPEDAWVYAGKRSEGPLVNVYAVPYIITVIVETKKRMDAPSGGYAVVDCSLKSMT